MCIIVLLLSYFSLTFIAHSIIFFLQDPIKLILFLLSQKWYAFFFFLFCSQLKVLVQNRWQKSSFVTQSSYFFKFMQLNEFLSRDERTTWFALRGSNHLHGSRTMRNEPRPRTEKSKIAKANRTMRTEIVFVQNGNHGSQYGSSVRKFVNPTLKNYNKILYIIKTVIGLM